MKDALILAASYALWVAAVFAYLAVRP